MELNPSTRDPAPRERPGRSHLAGPLRDKAIRLFFGSTALTSVVILLLITVFLFREAVAFFPQNYRHLVLYRRAGLELVAAMQAQETAFARIPRYLDSRRYERYRELEHQGLSWEAINDRLAPFDNVRWAVEDLVRPLSDLVEDTSLHVVAVRNRMLREDEASRLRRALGSAALPLPPTELEEGPVDLAALYAYLENQKQVYAQRTQELRRNIEAFLASPSVHSQLSPDELLGLRAHATAFAASLSGSQAAVDRWDPAEPVSRAAAVTSFLFGNRWVANSQFMDWFGVLPLVAGSLLVAAVALSVAIPLGLGSAIYVHQMAGDREQAILRPLIEFMAAIPTVLLGFLGVSIFGEYLRELTASPLLSWLPFFPMAERLSALTAGLLVAFMAIPTIFVGGLAVLAEVPRQHLEGSYALGGTRWQTLVRITLPAAIPGFGSAVVLGMGRVIGETMVVLLCAGNRLQIPDFTRGLGVVTEPVHTMTGLIAQEMGEVSLGSLHYRALFVVGILLFFVSLLVVTAAQRLGGRFRNPIL